MKNKKYISTLFLLTTACSTFFMSYQEEKMMKTCKAGNWQEVGKKIGEEGDENNFFYFEKGCAEHKVKPNKEEFEKGYKAGLAQYCSPHNAQYIGSTGASLKRNCPAKLQDSLEESYKNGLKKYCTRSKGYSLGESGKGINKNCSGDLENDFFEGYIQGKRDFEQKRLLEETKKLVEEQLKAAEERKVMDRKLDLIKRANYAQESCKIKFDCEIKDSCKQSKCEKTGASCTFDRDCTIGGDCKNSVCSY
jgi:hypothetical protein